MENNYQEEIIKELIMKIIKIVAWLMLADILFCIGYGIVDEVKNGKNQEIKIKYMPIEIKNKYKDDVIKAEKIMDEIRGSMEYCESKTENNKEINRYKDYKGREVYRIEQAIKGELFQGKQNEYQPTNPNDYGYVYNLYGNLTNVIELGNTYHIDDLNNIPKKYFENRLKDTGDITIINFNYNNENKKIREEKVEIKYNWYEKNIIEFRNEKKKKEKDIIDCESRDNQWRLIYVEITKEYDANEKLIKKFVLRKNKFNSIRSETNFDLIKGEIITKYFEGDKVFATVTETLIGKDRAIVKRERVGDKFVIWDFHRFEDKYYVHDKYWNIDRLEGKYDKHDVYVVNKDTGEVDCAMLDCIGIRGGGTDYNTSVMGVTKEEYIGDYNSRDNYEEDLLDYIAYCKIVKKARKDKVDIYENISEKYLTDKLYYKRINSVKLIEKIYIEKQDIKTSKEEEIINKETRVEKLKNIKIIEEEFRSGY